MEIMNDPFRWLLDYLETEPKTLFGGMPGQDKIEFNGVVNRDRANAAVHKLVGYLNALGEDNDE